jgi:hypothetical protein
MAQIPLSNLPAAGSNPSPTSRFASAAASTSSGVDQTYTLSQIAAAVGAAGGGIPVNWASSQFGADPTGNTDSTAAIQAAVNYAQANGYPLHPTPGTYTISAEIIVSGGTFFYLDGHNSTIYYNGSYPFISGSAPAAITSYPTASVPGPMAGSCFYVVTDVRYSRVLNLQVQNARFGFSFYTYHQRWTWENVRFYNCNCGVFVYAHSLAFTFSNCYTLGQTSNLFIGSATCYDSGNPFVVGGVEDVGGTDAFFLVNDLGYGVYSCTANRAWDTWFQNSILQPTVLSYAAGNASGALWPYSTTNDALSFPSGRAIYMPFRNARMCFQVTIRNMDNGGAPSFGGWGIINSNISQCFISGAVQEDMFNGYGSGLPNGLTNAQTPWWVFGSFQDGGVFENMNTEWDTAPDNGHPFARMTGAGGGYGGIEVVKMRSCIVLPCISTVTPPVS